MRFGFAIAPTTHCNYLLDEPRFVKGRNTVLKPFAMTKSVFHDRSPHGE